MIKNCDYCGKEFETKKRKGGLKYCSDKCRLASKHKKPKVDVWKDFEIRYNSENKRRKEHGLPYISYGKYVAMMEGCSNAG